MTDNSLSDQLSKIHREAEEREAKKRAEQLNLPYLDLANSPVQIDSFQLVLKEDAMRLNLVPIQSKGGVVALAVLDPENEETKKFIGELKKEFKEVKVFVGSASGLKHVWSYYKFVTAPSKKISGKVEILPEKFEELYNRLDELSKVKDELLGFDFDNRPTSDLIEVVLAGALRNRASDVHFEAEEKHTRFRYRIDGTLHDVVPNFPNKAYNFLVNRIKLLSNLKLNIKDAPQDGRFSIGLKDKEIEMRVSIIPSEFGETIVMRVLDPASLKTDLKDLGLRDDDLEIITQELDRPNGMLLNTGPTGSGKTTTLYAFLLYRRNPGIKIITIEDPIEYHLDDIEQTQADPEAGYTFATGLRSMMRQDPDVILVGEIRDKETAEIGIQAALTGHLVFSTVHANSSAGAIPRLLDLGVKPVSIGPALNLTIGQRLVRKLCESCKKPEKMSADLEKNIKNFLETLPKRVNREKYKEIKMFKAEGCKDCNKVGFKGRVAIFELLRSSANLKEKVSESLSPTVIQKLALEEGMVTMQQDGIIKVISGVTTLDEVRLVTGPIDFSNTGDFKNEEVEEAVVKTSRKPTRAKKPRSSRKTKDLGDASGSG